MPFSTAPERLPSRVHPQPLDVLSQPPTYRRTQPQLEYLPFAAAGAAVVRGGAMMKTALADARRADRFRRVIPCARG